MQLGVAHQREKRKREIMGMLQCWLDCLQSEKPNYYLAWLSSLINPVVYWLDCLQPDKPNCVLAWLDSLIKPTEGFLDCVFFGLVVWDSIVPQFLMEIIPISRVVVVLVGPQCECWLDFLQSDKPNCQLAWLSSLINLAMYLFVFLQPDKPICVLAQLDSLINPFVGWIEYV